MHARSCWVDGPQQKKKLVHLSFAAKEHLQAPQKKMDGALRMRAVSDVDIGMSPVSTSRSLDRE